MKDPSSKTIAENTVISGKGSIKINNPTQQIQNSKENSSNIIDDKLTTESPKRICSTDMITNHKSPTFIENDIEMLVDYESNSNLINFNDSSCNISNLNSNYIHNLYSKNEKEIPGNIVDENYGSSSNFAQEYDDYNFNFVLNKKNESNNENGNFVWFLN